MRVNADTMLSTKELGKTQARAKGIMKKELLEQLQLQYVNLLALVNELENIKIDDDDLNEKFNENLETLVSGNEAIYQLIKIVYQLKGE